LEDPFKNWRNPAYDACDPGDTSCYVFVYRTECDHADRTDRPPSLLAPILAPILTSVQPHIDSAEHPEQVLAKVLPEGSGSTFYLLRVGRETTPYEQHVTFVPVVIALSLVVLIALRWAVASAALSDRRLVAINAITRTIQ